jgi:hypothetical protein
MGEAREQQAAERTRLKADVVKALAKTGTLARACAAVGIARRTVWDWRQADKAFDARCAAALGACETQRLTGLSERVFRPRKLSARRQHQFLDMLAATGSVPMAAAAIKMTRSPLYALRLRDPAFAKAWDDAFQIGYAMVEESVVEEAIHGIRPRRKGERQPASERIVTTVFNAGQKRAGLARGATADEAERDRIEAVAAKWIADLQAAVLRSRAERGAAA